MSGLITYLDPLIDVATVERRGKARYRSYAAASVHEEHHAIEKAHPVFDKLQVCNIGSWNAMITGYVQHGHYDEALNCFDRMQIEGVSSDATTLVWTLKACGSIGASDKGQQIHEQFVKDGALKQDVRVGTALIDMYGKCGLHEIARELSDGLQARDVVSWTALISGYAHHGHGENALECFEQMQQEGLLPNQVTYACVLKACGGLKALAEGQWIHAEVLRDGFMGSCILVGTALIDMYVKCSKIAPAQQVFDELRGRNAVAWTALIAGYTQNGHEEKALYYFEKMQCDGISPNKITFTSILKACANLGALDKGQEINAKIIRDGLLEEDNEVGTAILDMYAKSGLVGKAEEVFNRLRVRDVVSWTALIRGFVQHGHCEKALECFAHMQCEGLLPDAVTFACMLKSCGSIGLLSKGQEMHAKIVREDLIEQHIVVANALMDMYLKNSMHRKAQEVFDQLPVRNVISWNSFIASHIQHNRVEEALSCYDKMSMEGISPDTVTFACVLSACGSIGAVHKGRQLHARILLNGVLEEDIVLSTALVDMYTKCGLLADAQHVFDKLPLSDVIAWNALITGYAQLGKDDVFHSLADLLGGGKEPDTITFTIVLNACSHGGLMRQGQCFFEAMNEVFSVIPSFEHHTCLVDLFCRAGQLDTAIVVTQESWFPLDFTVCQTFLSACKALGNSRLANWAFERATNMAQNDSATYVSLTNIYSAVGREEDVEMMEVLS